MFGLGHWELIIILVIVLMIFGSGKLPEIGGGLGKAIGSFKKGIKDKDSYEKDETQESYIKDEN